MALSTAANRMRLPSETAIPSWKIVVARFLTIQLAKLFSARYCGPTSGAVARVAVQPQTPPGVILGVDPNSLMGGVGEGVGTAYCKGVTGWNFCKTPGRESCPSCLQIQRNQSPACAQNPALCLAQNSAGEIEKAKLSCPTDPAFADPSFAAGAGAQAPAVLPAAGGVPAVVLPHRS